MGLWCGDATRLVGVQNPIADHSTYLSEKYSRARQSRGDLTA